MALVNIAERTSGITIFFSGNLPMPVPYLGVIPIPESSVIIRLSDKKDEDITQSRNAYRAVLSLQ